MRVTDKMIFDRAAAQTARTRERAQAAAGELSSGLRVQHPGDDPAAAGLVVSQRQAESRHGAIAEAARRASEELVAADEALGEVIEIASRARELAVQFANATHGADSRSYGAAEVRALLGRAIGVLNRQHGDRYLFGGHLDGSPPFAADGSYVGDAGVRQVEVTPGMLLDASVRADVAVKGVDGGSDLLATFADLAAALAANDVDGIRASLDGLDAGIAQVSLARAQAGASMNLFDAAAATGLDERDSARAAVKGLVEADVIEATGRLALAQRALEAALTASARTFELTLLDKLR